MSGMATVEIIDAAIAGEDATSSLHVFNVPGYASLRQATALRDLFPGLQTVRTVTVKTLTPSALLSSLDLANEKNILLIVDAPGEEMAILNGLLHAFSPREFAEIRFRCGEMALYEGGEGSSRVCALLREAGFAIGTPLLADDPDRPLRIASPDHAVAAARFKTQLAEREEALKAAQARQAAGDAELAKVRETLAARDKALAEREEALKAAQARQAAGDAELAKVRETLAARDEALEVTRLDLSLGLRLQSLRESDLKELQQRYTKLLEENEKQAKLLQQLTERLSVAALYLERIETSEHWLEEAGVERTRPTLEKVAGKA
jgi:hypothetical protein